MKNFWILLFSLLISSLVFVSCEDDTDDGNDPDAPQITLTGGDQEVLPGAFADYTLSILPGRSDLQSYRVLVDGLEADVTDFMIDGSAPISNPILLEGTDDEDGFNTSISFLAPDNSGASFEYQVEATDSRDRVSTSQLVTVSTASEDLIFEFSQEPGENFYEVTATADYRGVDFNAQTGNAPLNSIEIERGGVTVDAVDLLFAGSPGSNPFILMDDMRNGFTDFTIGFRSPDASGDSFDYTITLTDDNGIEKSLLLTVTTAVTLGDPINGQFYHMDGAAGCFGGYDLVNDDNVASSGSDADRDMLNTDVAPDPFTGSWMAENGTRYVDATGIIDDLNDINKANAESVFAAGSETASISNPQVNDFYVAQLRGGSDYAVIRIDRVDPNDNSCNASTGNRGIIEFTYVKG